MAERPAGPADYPGAKPELLVPASTVFRNPGRPVDLANHYNWWSYVPGGDLHTRSRRGPPGTLEFTDGAPSTQTLEKLWEPCPTHLPS